MARKQIVIQNFSGGIADDIRQQSANAFAITKHFDIFSNPNRLTPYRSTETDTNDGSSSTGMKQYDVRTFQLGSDNKLYGIGIQPGSVTRTKIVSKTDPTTGNWTLNATAEGGLNASVSWRNCFIEWQGAFWMFGGTTSVSKWVIGSTFTDTVASVGTIAHVAQGIIAPDNNLYIFYNNKVVRISPAGSVTDAVVTLPSDGRITNACIYGKMLAIGWASGTTPTAGGRSKLFLWDLVSADVSEAVDWGEGQLMVVGNLEGKVVGISDYFMSSSLGILQGSVVIRMYAGGAPTIIKELKATQNVVLGLFLRDFVIKANKLYFVAAIPFNTSTGGTSTYNLGIYAFGRKDTNSQFVLSLDYIEEAIDASNFAIKSFGSAGNYWFINHSADGSITKTDDQANYTFTSFAETQKYNFGDLSNNKKLVSVSVSTVPMPSAGQIVLKYKKNSDSSFTTISTITTDNGVSTSLPNISGAGTLPEFNEIQFRIESTGGAEPTSLIIVADEQKPEYKTFT